MIFLFLLSFFRSPWWFRFRRALRSLYLKRDGKKNKWNIKTDSPPTPATADNFRPYLSSFQGNSFTDYINAVFVDVSTPHLCLPRWVGKMGTPKYIIIHLCSFASRATLQGYTKPREYIVTEWPLQKTCGEFWSLVYDHECAAVVVLCQPPHNSVRKRHPRLSLGELQRELHLTECFFSFSHPLSATISCLLARGSPLEKVRTGVHDRSHLAPALFQHQVVDLPDQQEGHLAYRADGGRQGTAENGATLPAHLLADGPQGTIVHREQEHIHTQLEQIIIKPFLGHIHSCRYRRRPTRWSS